MYLTSGGFTHISWHDPQFFNLGARPTIMHREPISSGTCAWFMIDKKQHRGGRNKSVDLLRRYTSKCGLRGRRMKKQQKNSSKFLLYTILFWSVVYRQSVQIASHSWLFTKYSRNKTKCNNNNNKYKSILRRVFFIQKKRKRNANRNLLQEKWNVSLCFQVDLKLLIRITFR